MPDREESKDRPNPREDDIMAGDRRISRPDSALPDWYIPDTSYRPIPIAWFAAAIVVQTVAISVIFFVFIDKSGWFTIALAGLASLGIFHWSWDRGINGAGTGWQIATIIMMAVQFLLICIGASNRL